MGSYLRAIASHPIVVALVTLAALAGALAWLSVRSETYEAQAQLLIEPLPQSDQTFLGYGALRDSGDPTRTVQTAAAVIETRAAAVRAARAMGEAWDVERVVSSVDVQPQGESNVLDVAAKADSEAQAVKLANSYARAALAIRDEQLRQQVEGGIARAQDQLEQAQQADDSTVEIQQRLEQLQSVRTGGDPTVGFAQRAVIGFPEGASRTVVLLLALIAGLALGSGAAVLLELFTRRVRNDDELLALYPLPILARVPLLPRRQRAGGPGLSWHMPAPVREGFRTLIAQLAKAQDDGPAAIMMTSPSTGDGKTTSAVNLAVALASSGRTVILLDLDIRKPDIGRALGMQASAGPMSLLTMTSSSLGSLLQPVPQLPSLLVLPIGATAGDAGLVEAVNARVPDLLEEARGLAEYVVIDTAPLGEVSDALTISRLVDEVIVVARSGHTNRTNLTIMRDLLERAGRPPTGYLLIGEAPGASTSYYAHGVAGRPLFAEPEDVSRASSP